MGETFGGGARVVPPKDLERWPRCLGEEVDLWEEDGEGEREGMEVEE